MNEPLYQTAVGEYRAGRFGAAEGLCRQIVEREPAFARAWQLLGLALHQRGDVASAIECLERAIGLTPEQASFYVNLATIYRLEGRWSDAEHVLRRGLDVSPDYAPALMALGLVLHEQN